VGSCNNTYLHVAGRVIAAQLFTTLFQRYPVFKNIFPADNVKSGKMVSVSYIFISFIYFIYLRSKHVMLLKIIWRILFWIDRILNKSDDLIFYETLV